MKSAISYILLMIFLVTHPAHAQQGESQASQAGIIKDDRVDLLVNKHIEINQLLNTMDGFRIQIFSESGANSKAKAQSAQEEFQSRFPETGVYLTFKSPNYKVRIGDFRTKLDAQRFLIELTVDYPNAFIISDQINLPKTEY